MRLLSSLAALAAAICLTVVPVSAAVAAPADPPGVDVSWPQCDTTPPAGPGFAVVGINDGLGNTTNPCLADQLAWAAAAPGSSLQSPVSLYVMAQDPGQ